MKNRKQDLQRLKNVTEAAWLSASQALREKAGEERAAAARLSDLASDRDRCQAQLAGDPPPDMGQIVSATRWMRWSEAERARLNVRLARVRADLAREQAMAKKAFARDHALEKLLGQIKEKRRGE